MNGKGKAAVVASSFKMDEGTRADTSLEALAKLKPVFHAMGTVTAGNSSQTSDGAAATVVMSAGRAQSLGIKLMAKFIAFGRMRGVDPGGDGYRSDPRDPEGAQDGRPLTLDQIDVIELNEAFAAQSLAVIRYLVSTLRSSTSMVVPSALGHPLGLHRSQAHRDAVATRCLAAMRSTEW